MSDKIWTAMEAYQPYADKRGHGDIWRRMTTERTSESMRAAMVAAAWGAAAKAAAYAAYATYDTAWTAEYEAQTIECIERAIKEAKDDRGRDMSNEMWTALEQYQPFADAQGNGSTWRKMTTERTPESMRAARAAARKAAADEGWKAAEAADAPSSVAFAAAVNAAAAWAAADAADAAAWAAANASDAAKATANAARFEARAIERITQAIKEVQP